MKENVLKQKSLDFGLQIVDLYRKLCGKNEYVLAKQLLRSGTSIGANIYESEYASSRADFVNKLCIALKEANETRYWIELLYRSNMIGKSDYELISPLTTEQLKLLTRIINTSKNTIKTHY